jgi:uncharacterized protein YcaQ
MRTWTASTGTGRPARIRAGSLRRVRIAVRLLAPFDPVVWDRTRFELFWGWAYRFEAYTPPRLRKLGYYALPLLWRDKVGRMGEPFGSGRRAANFARVRGGSSAA